jgi:uncharacterized protein (DUF1015 family)
VAALRPPTAGTRPGRRGGSRPDHPIAQQFRELHMSVVKPFVGIRYNTTASTDISAKLAPPYDILDQNDKDQLLGQDANNFVKIDLPFIPPKKAGPAEVYTQARQQLDAWLADGTFVQDSVPAIYVYHQAYTYEGTQYTRKKFFARLRLEPFGEGSIFPHERTFGGPKEDRLALTKACQANLSPIFGLYEDAQNAVAKKLEDALPDKPWATGTMDGVENRLWAVIDPHVIKEVTQLMQPKAIYIADGHHRTGTAMMYRDWLIEQQGPLSPEHPANFVLCVFCAMEDPGLLILPTHRVLVGLDVSEQTFAGDDQIELKALDVSSPTAAIKALADLGPQAVGMYHPGTKRYTALRPKDANILDALEPDHTPAWRKLGLAFLHAYLLERVVKPQVAGGKDPEIRYIKSDDGAVTEARNAKGTAFLMQPTTMEETRDVCSANDLMPQKSTYFYPKLASGLVINPLT